MLKSGTLEICKIIHKRTKGGNRLEHYVSRGPKYPAVKYEQIIRTENQ